MLKFDGVLYFDELTELSLIDLSLVSLALTSFMSSSEVLIHGNEEFGGSLDNMADGAVPMAG